jgi:hypothetical protein
MQDIVVLHDTEVRGILYEVSPLSNNNFGRLIKKATNSSTHLTRNSSQNKIPGINDNYA